MNNTPNNQPVYRQLMKYVNLGFTLLNESTHDEITEFVESQQHTCGAFIDRAGRPDIYYSLFGAIIASSLNLKPVLSRLKTYIKSVDKKNNIDPVHTTAIRLIKLIINDKNIKKPSRLSIFSIIFNANNKVNKPYQLFLMVLNLDAFYHRSLLFHLLLKITVHFYKIPKNAPCSITSALLLIKHITYKKANNTEQKLNPYFQKNKGFKAFTDAKTADLLSTAVALFALRTTRANIFLYAPDVLNFIEQSYQKGAFLSNDGDSTQDLEYTFYGLLALGTLK